MAIPTISYNSGVPNPPNNPSVDVTPMQQNTTSIAQIVDVDLIGFGVPGSGAHSQVNLQNTATTGTPVLPSILGGAGFETLYSSAINPATSPIASTGTALVNAGELLFTRGSSGTQIQLTGPGTPYVELLSGIFSRGYTFLPGGFIVQMGFSAINAGNPSTTTITFPYAFPNNVFLVFAQPTVSNPVNLIGVAYSTDGGDTSLVGFDFVMINPTGLSNFSWIAIGN